MTVTICVAALVAAVACGAKHVEASSIKDDIMEALHAEEDKRGEERTVCGQGFKNEGRERTQTN